MGLDMYLEGHKFLHNFNLAERDEHGCATQLPLTMEDGFEVKEKVLRLGVWRKHPNLHGYIVEKYAKNAEDDCRPISLSKENLADIIKAIKGNKLPVTKGFFFGQSYWDAEKKEHDAKDIATLEAAIAWLETDEEGVWRGVEYVANW